MIDQLASLVLPWLWPFVVEGDDRPGCVIENAADNALRVIASCVSRS